MQRLLQTLYLLSGNTWLWAVQLPVYCKGAVVVAVKKEDPEDPGDFMFVLENGGYVKVLSRLPLSLPRSLPPSIPPSLPPSIPTSQHPSPRWRWRALRWSTSCTTKCTIQMTKAGAHVSIKCHFNPLISLNN